MEENLIKKRIYELTQKDHLDSKSNEKLLKQYNLDKQNDIPLERSEARELLIMGNEKLVYISLRDNFGIYELDRNLEEYSVGMIGLVKAVDTFDLNRGFSFSTYAIQVIVNEVRMFYRKIKKYDYLVNKIVSINDIVVSCPDGDDIHLEDYLGEEDDIVECIIREQRLKTIENSLHYLNEAERISIIYGYGLFGNDKLTQVEISEVLDINQSYVSRIMKNGRKKIKILATPDDKLSLQDLQTKHQLLNKITLDEDFFNKLTEVK